MSEVAYQEYLNQLKAKFGSFVMDAEAGNDNKSAALRARKISMELRKDLQGFRKQSVDNDKSNTKHRFDKEDEAPAVDTASVVYTTPVEKTDPVA